MMFTVVRKVSAHLLKLSTTELLKTINDFVCVAKCSSFITSIQEFHSMVEKEVSLAVHCLTVTFLVTYREERLHFSKG